MMNHFLFTTNIEQTELDTRFNLKKWPIYLHTRNRKNLKGGDKVIFYQGGKDNHKFFANAKILSVTKTSKTNEINITNILKWKIPIDITEIYEKLEIIKQPKYYGVYLAGGIKKLTQKDFENIMDLHKSNS